MCPPSRVRDRPINRNPGPCLYATRGAIRSGKSGPLVITVRVSARHYNIIYDINVFRTRIGELLFLPLEL